MRYLQHRHAKPDANCAFTTALILRPRERLRSIVTSMSMSVCLSVRHDISGTTRTIFTKFLCMLPVSVARSSCDLFTIGRIACSREGFFFPIENAFGREGGWGCTAQAKYAIYDCLVMRCYAAVFRLFRIISSFDRSLLLISG